MRITAESKEEYNKLYELAVELGFKEDSKVSMESRPSCVFIEVCGSHGMIVPPKNMHVSNISFSSESKKDGFTVCHCSLHGDVKRNNVTIRYTNCESKMEVAL